MNFTYGWVYQTLYIFFSSQDAYTLNCYPTYINISKIEKTNMFIKMIPEFIKKSSKIIESNRCMPIIPTIRGIKLRALTAVTC